MSIRKRTGKPSDTYLQLIRRFPLRAIRTQPEADRASELLSSLTLKKLKGQGDAGVQDYLDALAVLLHDYESKPRAAGLLLPDLSPAEILKHLMDEQAMNVNALGKIIGSQSTASMLLSGKRELSKSQIVKLAAYFHVSPALLLPLPGRGTKAAA